MPSLLKEPPYPQIKKLHGTGRELEEIQRAIDTGTREARKNPENKGRRLDNVRVPASTDTPNTVTLNHKLGRMPLGIRVVEARTAEARYFVVSKDSRRIVLQGTGTAASEADFWVF
jgi:hypothetical protein